MTMNKTLATITALMLSILAFGQNASKVWCPDLGNGEYKNPVLNADYSDPDVCAVGDDFYLTASSFNCIPGLPILHSIDLVNWEIIGYALDRIEPEDVFSIPQHGKGVWAPSIRYHNKEFYIYWGDPDYGIFMVKTSDPAGKWEKPILVKAGQGMIDPCPLWDEDGKAYLVHAWANSRAGFNSVLTVSELSQDGAKVLGNEILVFDGNDGANHTVEGPKFYKKNGWYYIMAPAGGVPTGWQIVLRSKNVYGPYECKVVMTQGNTDINGPHQGGWVETNTGESWFMNFQDNGAYGRVVHLNPMIWKGDWPIIGIDKDGDGCGEPVTKFRKPKIKGTSSIVNPVESDEFNTRTLGLQWQWNANRQDWFGFASQYGYFRLYGHKASKDFVNMWEVPNLLLEKFPAEEFTATTKIKVSAKMEGNQSGIIIFGLDYCRLSIERVGDNFVLKQVVCTDADKGGTEKETLISGLSPTRTVTNGSSKIQEKELYLRVKVSKGARCTFSYSQDGKKYFQAGETFTARKGKWIGAKVGMFSLSPADRDRGWVDIDWFHIE